MIDKTKQHRTWLPPLQMARFFAAAKEHGPQVHAMVMLLGECALRAEEACSLRIENMTRIEGHDVIRFIGKGNRAAVMPLPVAVMRAVQVAIGDRTHGPIILNTEGNAYTPNSLWRLIKRIAVTAGLDPTTVSPHTLRRTTARTAIRLGLPLHKVQALLRHQDPKTTMDSYVGQSTSYDDHASHQVAGFYESLAS